MTVNDLKDLLQQALDNLEDYDDDRELNIEFFPRDSEIINIANVRHIWILPDDRLVNECLRLN